MRANVVQVTLAKRLVAEGLGTALLVAVVVGSGIMAQGLAKDPAVALLCNTLATGAGLVAILLTFGGVHVNPAVTVYFAVKRELTPRDAVAYIVVQIAGAIAGALLANAMFDLPMALATTVRGGFPRFLGEVVATFGLVGVVVSVEKSRVPFAVAAYIVAAYWFTSSTSFANPAITIGRAFSDSYAGIRPTDVAGFIAAQAAGAGLGAVVFGWLQPSVAGLGGSSRR